jgi:aerobic C4-dicarboxylate transport protein
MAIGTNQAAAAGEARPWYRHSYAQVLVAIAAGIAVGHFAPAAGEALKPLGDLFVKLVRMVIAPVIFLTIVTGIAGMRDLGAVGRVAAKAFAWFAFFSTLALVIGMVVGNVVRPGAGLHIDPATLDQAKVADFTAKAHDSTISGFLLGVVPDTFISGLAAGNILQVLLPPCCSAWRCPAPERAGRGWWHSSTNCRACFSASWRS